MFYTVPKHMSIITNIKALFYFNKKKGSMLYPLPVTCFANFILNLHIKYIFSSLIS